MSGPGLMVSSGGSGMNSSLERSLELAAMRSDGLSDQERQVRQVKGAILGHGRSVCSAPLPFLLKGQAVGPGCSGPSPPSTRRRRAGPRGRSPRCAAEPGATPTQGPRYLPAPLCPNSHALATLSSLWFLCLTCEKGMLDVGLLL